MSDWILRPAQYELLAEGTWLTVQILMYSFALGVVLSLIFGVARMSERTWVRGAALGYIEFARGISSIILLFIFARAIPILTGMGALSLVLLGSVALGINMGGYGAEIVRGAIQAIPKGQTEATIALNLSPTQRLRHVVLPQAMRIILPPMGNLTIEILKGTALVSLIGLRDIMATVNNLRSQQLYARDPAGLTVLFINALLIYFILAQVINAAFRFWESRIAKRYEARHKPLPSHVAHPGTGVAG